MCAGDSQPEDKQPPNNYDLNELWVRGRLWEIFGFTKGSFTALELTHRYSILTTTYRNEPNELRLLDDAFAILNAPLTRQFYEGCRATMQLIRKEIGDTRFEQSEIEIWVDLWGWVSKRWQPPADELIRQLVIRYSADESGLLDKGQLDAFQLSQCSWCRSFYKSPLSCPLNKVDWNCISFESLNQVQRQELISHVKWEAKMLTVIERVQKEGIIAKCRECGAINLNPNTFECWQCGRHTLSCPSCQYILRYDIERNTWSCTNDNCQKKYAYRQKQTSAAPEPVEDACPNCGRQLYYDKQLLLWKCKNPNCKHIYTHRDLRTRKSEESGKKKKSRKTLGLAIGLSLTSVILILATVKPWQGTSNPEPVNVPDFSPPEPTAVDVPPLTEPPPTSPVHPASEEETFVLPPNDSDAIWNDSSEWSYSDNITVQGYVRNAHRSWGITDAKIEVGLYDQQNNLLDTVVVEVSDEILPGLSQYYHSIVKAPLDCWLYELTLTWYWNPPD